MMRMTELETDYLTSYALCALSNGCASSLRASYLCVFSGTGSSVYSNLSGHADACLPSILHTLLGAPDMYQPGLTSTHYPSYI